MFLYTKFDDYSTLLSVRIMWVTNIFILSVDGNLTMLNILPAVEL